MLNSEAPKPDNTRDNQMVKARARA
jgi:hypothetical protein